ncbi:hypothetical protein IWQ61_005578 [Dispira simplex]|nr:hypothetical protein IWQ61_005578 [Dispira simplex]
MLPPAPSSIIVTPDASTDNTQTSSSDIPSKSPPASSKSEAGQVGLSTAVVRSVLLKPLYLWYRTPLKLFRPLRVDYWSIVRSLAHTPALGPTPISTSTTLSTATPANISRSRFWTSLPPTSIGLLSHIVRKNGVDFLARYIFPPLFANSFIGTVLFTTYAYYLPRFQAWSSTTIPNLQESGPTTTNVAEAEVAANQQSVPIPTGTLPVLVTQFRAHQALVAGVLAGGIAGFTQAWVATPFDNLTARFQIADLISGKYPSMMYFVRTSVQSTGILSLWKGAGFTVTKDTLGFAFFFGTFEGTKQWLYNWVLHTFYSTTKPYPSTMNTFSHVDHPSWRTNMATTVYGESYPLPEKPHPLLRPSCVLVAGAIAALGYQLIEYPVSQFNQVLRSDLAHLEQHRHPSHRMYQLAWRHCRRLVKSKAFGGSYRRLFYSGFAVNSLKALPATALGFLCFELVRDVLEDDSDPSWGRNW